MKILGGPWAPSGGPGGSSGDFQAMDLIAREAPGALGEGLGASQGFLEDPRASPGLRRSSGIPGVSSSSRYQTRGIWEDRGQTSGIESEGPITHSEGFFHRRFPFPR